MGFAMTHDALTIDGAPLGKVTVAATFAGEIMQEAARERDLTPCDDANAGGHGHAHQTTNEDQ